MSNIFVSKPMKLVDEELEVPFARADVQLLGLTHSGASYEGRIFVNNPKADERTVVTPKNGYLGCFFVFGHGGCFGSSGHCRVFERRRFDPRLPHHLTPLTKSITVSEALRSLVKSGEEFILTIVAVPIAYEPPDAKRPYLPEFDVDRSNVLSFEEIRVVTYD